MLAATLVILSNTQLQKWGQTRSTTQLQKWEQTRSTTQLQNEGSTMVLNGIVNFGRNDHKAATQDNFRPLIMAFRLHEGKFAFYKDQIQATGKVLVALNKLRTFSFMNFKWVQTHGKQFPMVMRIGKICVFCRTKKRCQPWVSLRPWPATNYKRWDESPCARMK